MPYITKERRQYVDDPNNPLTSPGDLTYAFCKAYLKAKTVCIDGSGCIQFLQDEVNKIVARYLPERPHFEHYCTIMGALVCADEEIYRREGIKNYQSEFSEMANTFYSAIMAPYEIDAIARNGDIFV
jgi:hypothetical protein